MALPRLRRAAGDSRGWSDAYGHALVATGRVELTLDPVINPWDCAPFLPILHEASGFFGDLSDDETVYAGQPLSTTSALPPDSCGARERSRAPQT